MGPIGGATASQKKHPRMIFEGKHESIDERDFEKNHSVLNEDKPMWVTIDISETDPSVKDNPSPIIAPRVRRLDLD
jgi:hypothetical protein